MLRPAGNAAIPERKRELEKIVSSIRRLLLKH
jgi:hypothetical protein